MSYDYQIGQVLTFDVYPAPVLGNNFQNVTVQGILNQESANQVVDTVGLHIKVWPWLEPQGTPNDPSQYNYIKIKTQSGSVTALGMPWINESTIQAITSQTITALISNVTASDIQGVQNALISNGYTAIDVSISSA
ncbi:phage DNA polymerase-associated SH3 family protein [Paraburkholderia adhaesiva]|uniref:phage DNA polymerase-associated SH3 family protein n=1 Tax=Paraburkholderia adhaesiva TaxID=2883244 RepID=UPI001F2DF94C|nr:phage DNA polymerase-associated SH3 family protein [Paraburkholderia adhaesiva]